jgi:RNA polymerase sigma-70 factor (family 1)
VKKSDNLYEKILLEKLKADDKTAFSYIFSAYYKDLVLFASTFTNDINTSEEIVQNVFVKFWENRQFISIDKSLKSYLLKTVQNKSIDWLRHLKIRDKYQIDLIQHLDLVENDTENYMLTSELEQSIEKAISQLPEEIAEAFKMSRYDDLKYHEIAEKLNVSVRTIEVRIGKALNLLREQLKDYLMIVIIFYKFIS